MPALLTQIEPGQVLTLKSRTGDQSTYQIQVFSVGTRYAESVRVTTSAWRQSPEDKWISCSLEVEVMHGDSVTIER